MEAWQLLAGFPPALLGVHATFSRFFRPRLSNQMITLAAIGASLALALAGELASQRRSGALDGARAAYVLLSAGCAGYCYFHFFNMTETSRRIKLLRMMSGIGREEAAKTVYDLDDILKVRLARLTAMKQIRLEKGRYLLAGRTLYVGYAVLERLKRILALEETNLRS